MGGHVQQAMSSDVFNELKSELVEPDGFEPTTSGLQSRRSPN